MIQNSGHKIKQYKQANKLIGSKKAKDYCPNLNQKEIQVYGNDNECIQSKKQLFQLQNIKKWMENNKQSKKHWKKPGNPMIKQKYKLAQK